jgi:hypothetical protein
VAGRSICRKGTLLSAMGRGRAGSAQEACLNRASLLPAILFGGRADASGVQGQRPRRGCSSDERSRTGCALLREPAHRV